MAKTLYTRNQRINFQKIFFAVGVTTVENNYFSKKKTTRKFFQERLLIQPKFYAGWRLRELITVYVQHRCTMYLVVVMGMSSR